ncbi:hypothetical protein J7F03_30195 [Streptomyces sp. ISL-43]|uniref:hypothetical protein n=1 Tax=Streptomyces sp. ISL-43 TaxID=2819183 RepID=UPI001BEA44BF|nr:hypothetical protein [Streptomyces sp. ISL-43]MBT2451266.1 hypothetical protein [Streptomyces sp. ISL-43]
MSTAPEPEDAKQQEKVDRDLAGIAKILAGVFLAIAGVGTAFGLSQDSLLVAVNNDLGLFIGVGILALLAVGLSVVSLFFRNDKSGNVWQVGLLAVGVAAYLAALVLVIAAVANYATGHGRPNVSNLSVTYGSPLKVNFTVHADGVNNDKMVIVEVEAFKDKVAMSSNPLYRTALHADDKGDIEQKVEFVMEQGDATRLTIRAFEDHGSKGGETCEASQTSHKLGCATVLLPPPVPVAKKQ